MKIIEIEALENGAHRNQDGVTTCPDGWAIIPEDMEIPETFPFVDIEVEQILTEEPQEEDYDDEPIDEGAAIRRSGSPEIEVEEPAEHVCMVVTAMTAGIVPEPGPEPDPEPDPQEDTDAMLIDHELRISMLELGLEAE